MITEKVKAYKRKYYEKNKELVKAKALKYYREHPEQHLISNRKYCKKNKEKVKAWHKKYREENKERIKKYSKNYREYNKKRLIKLKYNLSHEEWLMMWESQDRKCLICGRPFVEASNACVDHNHKTGKVRGLLCKNCNFVLGLLHDDPEWAIKISEYLTGDNK